MKQSSHRVGFLLTAMASLLFGCGAPLIPILIWAGKIALTAAITQAAVRLVDQILQQENYKWKEEVQVDREDPARGILPTLKLTRGSKSETFPNVPVMRGPNGLWKVEKYYADSVIEPRMKNLSN
ncbi:MAG: hypothetical protein EBV06_05585 [Planctomycetia bacterium]|nr:hypothetical protein [Planctomycetia bacterium]